MVEADFSARPIAPSVRRRRFKEVASERDCDAVRVRPFWGKAAAFVGTALLVADVLLVVLLTEGAVRPSLARQIIGDVSPAERVGVWREVAASRNHFPIGQYYAYGLDELLRPLSVLTRTTARLWRGLGPNRVEGH
jgi:hypothetical protein